jgi:hypothetical protein
LARRGLRRAAMCSSGEATVMSGFFFEWDRPRRARSCINLLRLHTGLHQGPKEDKKLQVAPRNKHIGPKKIHKNAIRFLVGCGHHN